MCVISTKNVCFVMALNLFPITESHEIKPRAVGGYISEVIFPFMASLQIKTLFGPILICGGSIINPRTIVTAAHCLSKYSAPVLFVQVGTNSCLIGEGEQYNVFSTYYHEKWRTETDDYDVGLVRIEGCFTFSDTVQPIELADGHENISDGSYAALLGWGFTDLNNPKQSDVLRVAEVPIVNQDICNLLMNGRVTERMICAGFRNGGVDACTRDSGGPLIANGKLIGIISWGDDCGLPNKPGVYARVSELRYWIEDVLAKEFQEFL